ncbi:hypothetical protein AK830_g12686, partial [Neonectria ditissima]
LRYSTPDSELLAIEEAFRTWRHYLAYADTQIEVLTDHLNHRYLATKPKLSSKQVAALDNLHPFDFKIIYRPGAKNPADGLSRRPDHFDKEAADRARMATLPLFLSRFEAERQESSSEVAPEVGPDCEMPDASFAFDTREQRGSSVVAPEVGPDCRLPVAWVDDPLGGGESTCGFVSAYTAAISQSPRGSLVARLADLRLERADEPGTEISLAVAMRNAQEADSFCQEKLQMIRREATAKKPAKKRGAKWSISENGLLCRSQRIYVPPVPIRPWEEISMDFITDLPPVTREKGYVSDSILVIVN